MLHARSPAANGVAKKKKTKSKEPSGECTITSKTVDDWLDPCASCYGVIRTDKLKTENCGHSYHSHCHLRWFSKAKACPLCFRTKLKDGVRSSFKCPLCNELTRRDEWLEHCAAAHRVIRCKRCTEIMMFHNTRAHASMKCQDPATIPVGCPALYCTKKVPANVADRGMKDARVLLDDHDCSEVFECSGCGECFLFPKDYEKHLAEQASAKDHLAEGFTSGNGKKRKRAAVEESEKLGEYVGILKKKGVFKKLRENPMLMSRKRLMQIIEENKHLLG